MKAGKYLLYLVLLSALVSACGGSGQQMASVSPSQSKGAEPQSNPALPSEWLQPVPVASTLSNSSSPADESVPTQELEQQQAPAPTAPTTPVPPRSDIPRAPQPPAPTEPRLPSLPPQPSPDLPSQPYPPGPSITAPPTSVVRAPTESRLRNAIEEFQEFKNQPALSLVKAQYAYARGASGKGVVIGMVDDGIDRRHREFSGGKIVELTYASGYTPNYDSCPSGRGRRYGGICYREVDYHGTSVGGVLVGGRHQAQATDSYSVHGIAYGAKLAVTGIRLESGDPDIPYNSGEISDSEPSASDSFYARIFNWLNSRVAVANMSFLRTDSIAGTGREKLLRSFPTALEALKQTNTDRADRTVYVWAAGNYSGIDSTVRSNVLLYAGFPLRITELQGQFIAVVAVDNRTGVIAPYSNHCGLSKAFCLAAPGTVTAPVPGIVCGQRGIVGCYGNNLQGTSYATPLVAGGFALLKQHFQGQLGHHEIVDRLLATANDDGIYANEDIYGQGLLDLDAATRPVGTTRLLTGENLGGASAREKASSMSLGPAFGDAFQRGFASRNIAAFDTLNAPFFRPLDGYVQPVPAASVTLSSRLSALGNTQAMTRWSNHGFDFSAQAVQSERDDEAAYSGAGVGNSLDHANSTLGMFSVTRKFGDREGYLGFRMHPGWRLGLYGAGALKMGTFSEDTAFANPMLSLVRNGATAGISLNGISSTVQNLRVAAFAGNSQYGDRRDDTSSQAHGAIVEYSPFNNQKSGLSVQVGWLQEPRRLVGSRASGAFGGLGANTGFAGLSAHTSINKNWTLLANLHGGLTRTSVKKSGMITDISPLRVSAFDLGLSGEDIAYQNDTLALRVSQPLRVESSSADVRWISGRTRYEEINVEQQSLSLEPSGRQIDIELTYGRPWRSGHANFGAIVSRHPGHSAGTSDSALLMRYNRNF